jgi:hypothetical protein
MIDQYVLHINKKSLPNTSLSMTIYADNEKDALWKAFVEQTQFINEANADDYDVSLKSKNNSPETYNQNIDYNYNFQSWKMSPVEREIITDVLIHLSIDAKSLGIEIRNSKMSNMSENLHWYALCRAVFNKLWDSSFPYTVAVIHPDTRLMMMYKIMHEYATKQINDYSTVSRRNSYSFHIMIKPILGQEFFSSDQMALISNAFEIWETTSEMENISPHISHSGCLVYSFSVPHFSNVVNNMRYWLDRHGVSCNISGIATNIFYDYFEFESNSDTDINELTYEANIGSAEFLERHADSDLIMCLKDYYNSER